MATQVVLILGAGPRNGAQAASRFAAKGYSVALASRSMQDKMINDKRLELNLDLGRPEFVPAIFTKVKEQLGIPNVVIYNACAHRLMPGDDPLSALDMNDFSSDTNVNLTSAISAAKEAVRGFKELAPDAARTFIYSGNKLNVMSDPRVLPFGVGKTGAAHMIWDCVTAYQKSGFNFYFIDQRRPDGSPAREIMDPAARADACLTLAEDSKQGPWNYTFVKDQGYVDFRRTDRAWDVDL